MRQHYILIDSIETLQDLLLPLTSYFEGVAMLLFKNSKNSCQSNVHTDVTVEQLHLLLMVENDLSLERIQMVS